MPRDQVLDKLKAILNDMGRFPEKHSSVEETGEKKMHEEWCQIYDYNY